MSRYITTKETADKWRVSVRTVQRAIQDKVKKYGEDEHGRLMVQGEEWARRLRKGGSWLLVKRHWWLDT